MKYMTILFAFGLTLMLGGCNDGDTKTKTNCEELGEWKGFDEDCGCYGVPISFSHRCISTIVEGDIPYFGYVNYGHIKDSILLVFNPNSLNFYLVTISEFPSTGFPSIDVTGTNFESHLQKNKKIQLMYDDSYWDNPDALGAGTEVRIDPKEVVEEPEQITLGIYQRKKRNFGSEILDSIKVVLTKDINRR